MSNADQITQIISDIGGGSLFERGAPAKGGAKKKRKRKTKAKKNIVIQDKDGNIILEDDAKDAGCNKCCNCGGANATVGVVGAGKKQKRQVSAATKAKLKAGAAKSPWIMHVKQVAKDQGITYGQALKVAGKTFKKKGQ